MSTKYRVLVARQPAGGLHEYVVSSSVLWVVVSGALSVLGLGVVVGFVWGRSVASRGPIEPRMPVSLVLHASGLGSIARSVEAHVAGLETRSKPPPESACAEGMVLVEGGYCPTVHQRCRAHTDPDGSSLYSQRCASYEAPTRCLNPERQPLRFCIDKTEFVAPRDTLPLTNITPAQASERCAAVGKRLCTETEWVFACEGEEMLPYPYGYQREGYCNADHADLVAPDGSLRDFRAEPGRFPRCRSSFGVLDMSGNVEEMVVADAESMTIARKGAFWQAAANGCRARQVLEDARYQGIELGFRCCAAPTKPAS